MVSAFLVEAADGAEGLGAQVVLDLAGVLAGDLHPLVGQMDEAAGVHGDIAVLPQALGGIADAGLGDAQLFGDVDGADVSVLFLEHEHCFKIILCAFSDNHKSVLRVF